MIWVAAAFVVGLAIGGPVGAAFGWRRRCEAVRLRAERDAIRWFRGQMKSAKAREEFLRGGDPQVVRDYQEEGEDG